MLVADETTLPLCSGAFSSRRLNPAAELPSLLAALLLLSNFFSSYKTSRSMSMQIGIHQWCPLYLQRIR